MSTMCKGEKRGAMRERKEWGTKGLLEGRRGEKDGTLNGEGETGRPEKKTQEVKKRGRRRNLQGLFYTCRFCFTSRV